MTVGMEWGAEGDGSQREGIMTSLWTAWALWPLSASYGLPVSRRGGSGHTQSGERSYIILIYCISLCFQLERAWSDAAHAERSQITGFNVLHTVPWVSLCKGACILIKVCTHTFYSTVYWDRGEEQMREISIVGWCLVFPSQQNLIPTYSWTVACVIKMDGLYSTLRAELLYSFY